MQAWRGGLLESGKRSIVFKISGNPAYSSDSIPLPCGQCIGCKLERSRQWAMRCVHESSLYDRNCFVTLTFDKAHLPLNCSVDVRDFQLFMKRLRKAYPDDKIRFFHCGEYGRVCKSCGLSRDFCARLGCNFIPSIGRPHYHACLFNFDFPDKVLYKVKNGSRLYVSESLTKIWSNGEIQSQLIGDVTFASAAYVARYIVDKLTGDAVIPSVGMTSSQWYGNRNPEYVSMSRGGRGKGLGGIGKGWFDKFKSDIYPSDYAIMNGVKVRPPKFYDGLYESEYPEEFERLKSLRAIKVNAIPAYERGAFRLPVKEECKIAQIRNLSRSMEVVHED